MKIFITIFTIVFTLGTNAYSNDWQTFFEKSGGMETPRLKETLEYCYRMASVSDMINMVEFGRTPQGRPLVMMIVDKEGLVSPEEIRKRGRVVLLVESAIHPGEPDGKDAMLMLVRDIALTQKHPGLEDNVSILFIPVFNADGHERFGKYNRINQNGPVEMGWRVTAQNYNLNRDFLKADSPEMQAWLKLYNKWQPEFFIDCHTTDGADYQYVLTYKLETYGNMLPDLSDWQTESYLPYIIEKMQSVNYPVFPYVYFRRWHDPRSGLHTGAAPPMLSQGYTALRNRPGLLIETHMLKPYKQRVEATYEMIRFTMELLAKDHEKLMSIIEKADFICAFADFRKNKFPVKFRTSYEDSVMVDFLGIDYTIEESDLSGGLWFKYNGKPKTFRLPFFDHVISEKEVELPDVYIIPAEWTEVIKRLDYHGIEYEITKDEQTIMVDSYKLTNPDWAGSPYEGRFRVSFNTEKIKEERTYPPGSVMVPMNQPLSMVIAYLLEPEANGSLASWGFFNSIFTQKEYSESYVMEEMAREMLAKDPELKKEFMKKIKSDSSFAGNTWGILNWFYSKTPYWDEKKDKYPVGKIFIINK